MEQHPVLGYEMLRDVTFLQGEGLSVVRSHHERWDGRGYPDGLAGTDIPLAARIFSVADALDAMTSERPYRMPRPGWTRRPRSSGSRAASSTRRSSPRSRTASRSCDRCSALSWLPDQLELEARAGEERCGFAGRVRCCEERVRVVFCRRLREERCRTLEQRAGGVERPLNPREAGGRAPAVATMCPQPPKSVYATRIV